MQQKGRVTQMTIKAMGWVTGGLVAVLSVGSLAAPAWADFSEAIPTASTDQWHAGWCNKSEEGYSVLIDFAALGPKDRGDLNPATTRYTDAHVKDGWFVRCHKGLESVSHAKGWDYNAEIRTANWAAAVGVPGTVDPNEWHSFLGLTPDSSETSSGDRIRNSAVTVMPGKDGTLPPWPEKVHDDEDYPGKPDDVGYLALPEKPVKGMAVAIALYPDGHAKDQENPDKTFYFAGDNPNRPEHRPQYAYAPAPTPTVSPKPSPTPTVTPRPAPGRSGSPVMPGTGGHSHSGHPGLPDPNNRGGTGGSGAGAGSASVGLPATGV